MRLSVTLVTSKADVRSTRTKNNEEEHDSEKQASIAQICRLCAALQIWTESVEMLGKFLNTGTLS